MKEAIVNHKERLRLIAADAVQNGRSFAEDVARGLTETPKTVPCRHLYDAQGSRLFETICALPEYYLTRAETEILRRHAGEIATLFPRRAVLVELGSGSSTKTRLLIDAFLAEQDHLTYVPIDICREMLENSARALLDDFPRLEVSGISAEYESGLRHLPTADGLPKLLLFLGSNLGNFCRDEAIGFLGRIRETMSAPDRLLVGIDLRKERETLERAYDDDQGVTARFNLNLLGRINRELGGHFDLDRFQHRATYNSRAGRVELRLVSRETQVVSIDALDLRVSFKRGEVIETENSHKFTIMEIQELATAAGLQTRRRWFDRKAMFSLNLFAPA